jgi:hypothetical protein
MDPSTPTSPGGTRTASETLLEAHAETERHARLAGVRLKHAVARADLGAASTATAELGLKLLHVGAGLVEDLTPTSATVTSFVLPCVGARPGRAEAEVQAVGGGVGETSPSQRLLDTAAGLALGAQLEARKAIDTLNSQLPAAEMLPSKLQEGLEQFLRADEEAQSLPESMLRRHRK